jgi:hypothetical protein
MGSANRSTGQPAAAVVSHTLLAMGLLRGLVALVGGLLAGVAGLLKGVLTGVGSLLRRLV